MDRQKYILKILRSNPAKNDERLYHTYELDLEEESTVLQALRAVQEKLDSSLAFNFSCRRGLCGACEVKVNGKPVMSCSTKAEKEMVIEPNCGWYGVVLRDLVVDHRLSRL